MKTYSHGTIDEWIQKDPNALLINRYLVGPYGLYFPVNTCITLLRKLDEPIEIKYESHYPDGEPYFMMGSRCPYICTGKFKYIVQVLTTYGQGTMYPLTESQANNPNWQNISSLSELV